MSRGKYISLFIRLCDSGSGAAACQVYFAGRKYFLMGSQAIDLVGGIARFAGSHKHLSRPLASAQTALLTTSFAGTIIAPLPLHC